MTHTASSLMPYFGLIRVSGEDRAIFLHNQLSNDINHLSINHACLATYNTAKGRVIANMLVLKRDNDIIILTSASLIDTLQKKLQIYIMRSKVKLEIMTDWGAAVSVPETISTASEPQYVLPTSQTNQIWSITLPDGSIIQIGQTSQLPPFNAEVTESWKLHEITSGNPWISKETTETCVAQMLNQQLIGAVHFKKGCYPGQEIIARAQYRGQVKRGLALMEINGSVSSGKPIFDNHNEEVGLIINQVSQQTSTLALAVIKHSAAESELKCDNNIIAIKKCFFNPANIENS